MPYNNATICLNGHIVSKYDACSQKYCSKCGAQTISFCAVCDSPIHGLFDAPGSSIRGYRPLSLPYYCYECGTPYPWTKKILDNAVELVSLDEELDDSSKELIKSAIPELITETPFTPVAVAKYQKGIASAGQVLKNSLYQLLTDVLSEAVKKALFP